MGDFNVIQGYGRGQAMAAPGFVTVSSSVNAHVKGGYTTLLASLDFNWKMLHFFLECDVNRNGLFDIAVGGAGAEQVIFPNIFVAGSFVIFQALNHSIPVDISAGSRLSGRWQSSVAGVATAYVIANGSGSGFTGPQGAKAAITLGAITATTRGTTLLTGAGVNVVGAWIELTPALAVAARYLAPMPANPDANASFLIDIAVGAAGVEQVIASGILWTSAAVCAPVLCRPVAAGQRLSARASVAVGAPARNIDFVLGIIP